MNRHFRTGARAFRIVAELGLVVLCVFLVLLIACVLRLKQGPVDAGFARSYIERSLSTSGPDGYNVQVDGVRVEWPHFGSAVILDLTNFQLRQHDMLVGTIDHARFGLSRVLLLAGQVVPISITLERPSLRLVREAGNHFAMSLQSAAVPDSAGAQDPFTNVIQSLAQERKLFDFGNPLALLKRFDIQDASLTVDDQVAGNSWQLDHANASFVHNRAGMIASAQLRVPGGRRGEARIEAAANYRRASNDYTVHASISNFDPRLISRQAAWLASLADQDLTLNGDVDGLLDANLFISRARLTLAAGPGALDMPSLYSRPLAFSGLGIDATYDRARGILDVDRVRVQTDGLAAILTGRFTIADRQLQGRATFGLPVATQKQVGALWPDRLPGSAQSWLTKKLSGGQLKNVAAAVNVSADLRPGYPFALAMSDVTADFDADNMTVDYCPPLRPATAAEGHGHFAKGALDIAVHSAHIGEVKATGGRVLISGLPDSGMADVNLQLSGPVASVLNYIAAPPLRIDAQKIGLNLGALRGTADATVHIVFPTGRDLRADEVKVTVDGGLSDVLLPGAVRGADLAADHLSVHADNGAVAFKGAGTLGDAPLTLDWRKTFGMTPGAAQGTITADLATNDALRAKLGLDPAYGIHGRLPVHLDYADLGAGKATLDIRADAGPAALDLVALGYKKAAGVPATLAASAQLQDGMLQDVHRLDIAAPSFVIADGEATFAPVRGKPAIQTLRLDRLRLNETDAAVRLETSGGIRRLSVKGAFFDARPFLKHQPGSPPYSGPAVQGTVSVATLRAGPAGTVRAAELRFGVNGQGMLDNFDLRGKAGRGALTARLGPSPHGGRDLTIHAADAGAALQAFDLYPNAVGGTLSVNGHAPASDPRTLDGHAKIGDFNVVHAPVLASILNGLSIAGLPGMLAGSGIHFSTLESDFTWQAGTAGSVITIRDGRTTGASLGLTFSGNIDTVHNQIDIGGDVVPFSGINGFLNNVPVLDDILSGGRHGGIFAATYSITGAPGDPRVSVNPLAALAPGFLRPLLFGR